MPSETWPVRPFDPACIDRVPRDTATLDAVRRVVADWDGENWAAVEPVLQRAGLLRPLGELTVFDIRMQFAVGQGDLLIRLGGRPETATGTLHAMPAPPVDAPGPPADLDDAARLTADELAERFGVSPDALRKRLDRWRKRHDGGWYELVNAGRGAPRVLYEVGAVRAVIEAAKASSARP
ncbi:MAG: hypothetical protein IPM13_01785 [Phycisphaerales bacterium]|nr:hypothetical protein [Phycisphaerales bacterium]